MLYSHLARKSFKNCQEYYKGYYNVVDLVGEGITLGDSNFGDIIEENIQKAKENNILYKIDDYTKNSFENNFLFRNTEIKMKKLTQNYNFLPYIGLDTISFQFW